MRKNKVYYSTLAIVILVSSYFMNGLVYAKDYNESEAYSEYGTEDPTIDMLAEDSLSGASWDSPTIIELDQVYTGSLETGNNYYQFTLGSSGAVNIEFDHEYDDSSASWDVYIYNKNDEENSLGYWEFKGRETVIQTTESLGIPAGDYIMEIKRPFNYSDKPYTFKIKYTESAYWETEANNTPVTATIIDVNKEYNGCLQFSWDKDYYVFELSNPGSITLSFNHKFLEGSYEYWNTCIYDYSNLNNPLLEKGFIGNATTTQHSPYVGLPAGKYALLIKGNYYYSLTDYSFTINYTQSDYWEKENNNNASKANAIEVNSTISGSLQNSGDVDFYSFTIAKPSDVSFSFSHDLLSSSYEYWYMDIYNYNDLNTSLLTKGFSGNATQTVSTEKIRLNEGKYIIKLSGAYDHTDVSYSLKVNMEADTVKVTGVSIEPKSVLLNVGEYVQLTATISPEDATNKIIRWKSSNVQAATVDSNGRVTGVNDGIAYIVVTTEDGGFTASAKVKVGDATEDDDASDPDIELIPDENGTYYYTLLLGEKYPINISGISRESIQSNDTQIVSVVNKKKGIVQGKKVGSTDVLCTVNGVQRTVHFKVEYPVICAVNNYVLVGDSLSFSVKGTKNSNVAWSVNNAKANISDRGELTGVSAGTTQVTARIHKINYKVKITVENPGFAKPSYKVKAGTIVKIKLGGTKQGTKVSYSISDENIATFTPDGGIAAISQGATDLIAHLGSKTFTAHIVVE